MKSIGTKLLISLGVLVLLFVPSFFFVDKLKDLNQFKPFILNKIHSKIKGKVELDDIKWSLQGGNFGFRTNYIRLLDLSDNVIFEAKNNLIMLKWDALIYGFNRLQRIKSESIKINLLKNKAGVWNLADLIKSSGRKSQISIDRFSSDHTSLCIQDEASGSLIKYDDMILNWHLKKFKKNYQVEIQSHRDQEVRAESSSNTTQNEEDSKTTSMGPAKQLYMTKAGKPHLKNYFRIEGLVPLLDKTTWVKSRTKFDYDIFNLDLSDFQAFLSSYEATKGLSGILSSSGTIKRRISRNLEAQGDIELVDLDWFYKESTFKRLNLKRANISFDSLIGNKNITVNNLLLNIEDIVTKVEGKVLDWTQDDPRLDLSVKSEEFSYLDALKLLPKSILPKMFTERFATVGDGLVAVDLKLKEAIFKPKVFGTINLKDFSFYSPDNGTKLADKVNLNLELKDDRILIDKFTLPVAPSAIELSGWLSYSKNIYELKVKSKDLALGKLRGLMFGLPFTREQRDYLRSFDIGGYANLDLKLSKSENEALKVLGTSKFGKVSFLTGEPRWYIRDLFGDINFADNQIKIEVLKGFFQGDYFETIGSIFLDDSPKLDLKFASNEIDLQNLIRSKLLDYLGINFKPMSSGGKLKDLALELKGGLKQKSLSYAAKVSFDNVSLRMNEKAPLASLVNGTVNLRNDFFKTDNLTFLYDKAPVYVNGLVQKIDDKFVPGLDVKINDLQLQDLFYFLDEYTSLSQSETFKSIHDQVGTVNLDAKLRENGTEAKALLNNIGFYYPQIPLVVSKLSGNLSLDDNKIDLENIGFNLGKSFIKMTGPINEYRSAKLEDTNWDLSLETEIFCDEIMPLMHKKFRKYLDFIGTMPGTIKISGNKVKSFIDAKFRLNYLDRFAFSNWLVADKSMDVVARSKLIITPQSIVSDRSKLIFKKNDDEKTKVAFIYEVKDWRAQDMSFYMTYGTTKANSDASLMLPHIDVLKPLNIEASTGDFKCETFGNKDQAQTICKINAKSGVAKKYGIGDLNMNDVEVDLLAMTKEPTKTYITASGGDWNTIAYKNLEFDLITTNDEVLLRNLKANIKDGEAWANTDLNLNTMKSRFEIGGYDLPVHDISQGMWGIGAEVPSGLVDGSFVGTTQGWAEDDLFFNMVSEANLIIKQGKLSQLVALQKYFTALNTFGQGIFGLDINNLMQTLITFKGGQFDYLVGALKYDTGNIKLEKVLLKSEQMELELHGLLDFKKDSLAIDGKGLIPKKSKSILQKVGVGLGNVISGDTEKSQKNQRFFDLKMSGKISDEKEAVDSLRQNFKWQD